MNFRVGIGYDVHRLGEGRKLMLGGIEIPSAFGSVAHSDGDVLIHAICDALLGAAGLGDIGKHFPDTSDEFKNIDSKLLLKRVNENLKAIGWFIGNIDAVICLQKPKLRDYIGKMQETLANTLDIPVEKINVKATTTEKLGFIGTGEGISAYATVLLSNVVTR